MSGLQVWKIVAAVLVLMNIAAFITYGVDKRRAIKNRWRVPERTLLLLAALGGGIGALAGMLLFHHKTKHLRFQILVPLFTACQLAAIGWWILSSIK